MGTQAILRRTDMETLVTKFTSECELYGPVSREGRVVFDRVTALGQLGLDYVTTALPPKGLFLSPRETLFEFDRNAGITAEREPAGRRRVLFGLHPCDLAGLRLLDRVLGGGEPGRSRYQRLREESVTVALNCTQAGPHCYCASFDTGPEATTGFDIVLTDLGDRFLAEAATDAGEEILADLNLGPASPTDVAEKRARLGATRAAISKRLPVERLPRLLNQNFDHPVWNEVKGDCLSCGACTAVCPTCYCFDVWDEVNLDLATGERKMAWDSCQLLDFGEVAQGHNFGKDRAARLKQRIYHKLSYFVEQYGAFGCVGCGRCTAACVKGIDIPSIVSRIGG